MDEEFTRELMRAVVSLGYVLVVAIIALAFVVFGAELVAVGIILIGLILIPVSVWHFRR